jgi:single-strand DNA-binding protein
MKAGLERQTEDQQRRLDSSGKVVSFSLATSDHWTDKEGERQERTEWHRVVAYND